MADHVEAFGLTVDGPCTLSVYASGDAISEPIKFDADPFTPSEPTPTEIARLRDVIQDAANDSAYSQGDYCSCGMAWDAAKAVLKAIRAP